MTAAPDDRAAFFQRLRADTARLLKLDGALTPSQQVRVDRAASLRLLLDQLQQRQLAGEEIDARQFVTASETLETLLGGNPEVATSTLASGEARAKLRALIETTLAAGEADDAARDAERSLRDEQQAALAAGASVEPAPSTPATVAPPPPERPANVVPLHYLREGQREPWRDFHDGRAPTGPHPWPLR